MFNRCAKHVGVISWLLGAVLTTAGAVTPALALDTPPDDREKLRECGKQICELLVKKEAGGSDLSCRIGRTWEKSKIVDGIKEKKISWGFGDARCSVDFQLKRQAVIDALSNPSSDFVVDKHTIKCQIEREEGITDVSIGMTPKMSFKDGKVEKIWLNISDVQAPALIKAGIVSVSWLEDNIGLFHSEMTEETNKFIQKCQQTVQ